MPSVAGAAAAGAGQVSLHPTTHPSRASGRSTRRGAGQGSGSLRSHAQGHASHPRAPQQAGVRDLPSPPPAGDPGASSPSSAARGALGRSLSEGRGPRGGHAPAASAPPTQVPGQWRHPASRTTLPGLPRTAGSARPAQPQAARTGRWAWVLQQAGPRGRSARTGRLGSLGALTRGGRAVPQPAPAAPSRSMGGWLCAEPVPTCQGAQGRRGLALRVAWAPLASPRPRAPRSLRPGLWLRIRAGVCRAWRPAVYRAASRTWST